MHFLWAGNPRIRNYRGESTDVHSQSSFGAEVGPTAVSLRNPKLNEDDVTAAVQPERF